MSSSFHTGFAKGKLFKQDYIVDKKSFYFTNFVEFNKKKM